MDIEYLRDAITEAVKDSGDRSLLELIWSILAGQPSD